MKWGKLLNVTELVTIEMLALNYVLTLEAVYLSLHTPYFKYYLIKYSN